MRPLVSVAMATCNGARFLREQLDSIYRQTYGPLEVLVADDRSVDDTVPILEEYRLRKGLRYWINDRRLGVVRNFEGVLRRCRGTYIALSDQDDIWLPTKIETLVERIDRHSLICSDAILCDGGGSVLARSFRDFSGIKVPPSARMACFELVDNFVTGCTAMFDRSLLGEALPIPDGAVTHDWWLGIVASRRRGIRYLAEPLVMYRQHGGNQLGVLKRRPSDAATGMKLLYRRWTSRTVQEARKRNALFHLAHLTSIRSSAVLSEGDRALIDELCAYHSGIARSRIHLNSIRILWSRRQILMPGRSNLEALVASLFGVYR